MIHNNLQIRHRVERDAAQREEQAALHRHQVQAGPEAARGGPGETEIQSQNDSTPQLRYSVVSHFCFLFNFIFAS